MTAPAFTRARLRWSGAFAPGREQTTLAVSRDTFLVVALVLFTTGWVTGSVALAVFAGSVLAVAVMITFGVRLLDWAGRDATGEIR